MDKSCLKVPFSRSAQESSCTESWCCILCGYSRESAVQSWCHYMCVCVYTHTHTHTHTHTLQGPGCTDFWYNFVYRHYRDLALFNLGAIFHQAHYPAEAAIILHAAVDHAPLMAQSHFLLGNVYAILGDCNR